MDADSEGSLGHDNSQYSICANSRTGYLVTFSNCDIFSTSNI